MTKSIQQKDKAFDAWARKWKLNREEREMLRSFEAGEWKPLKGKEFDAMKKFLQESARYTTAKSESISIRLSPLDLERVTAKAIEEGMPYQTLISSLIHKYVHSV